MSQLDTRIPLQVPNTLAQGAQISAMSAADQGTRNALATQMRNDAAAPIRRNALAAQAEGQDLQNLAGEREILGQVVAQLEGMPEQQRAAMWPQAAGYLAQNGVIDPQLADSQYTPELMLEMKAMAAPPAGGESYTLTPGSARFGPGGRSIAHAPAPERPGDKNTNVSGVGLVDLSAPGGPSVAVAAQQAPKPFTDASGNVWDLNTGTIMPGIQGAPARAAAAPGITGELEAAIAGGHVAPGTTVEQFATMKKPDRQDLNAQAGLRKEWASNNKDFKAIRDSFVKVQGAASNPSPAGDLSLIFNYMKMLDPGSVVREGEFATAQNAGGVDTQVRNMYNQIIDGTRLSPEQRQDFVGVSQQIYGDQLNIYKQDLERYRGIAVAGGMDPESTVPDMSLAEESTPVVAVPVGYRRTLADGTVWEKQPDNTWKQVK